MIFDILCDVANTTSRKEKENILNNHRDNELLRQVFFLAYSPQINFFIKKIPSYITDDSPILTLESAIPKLEKLSLREFTGNDAILYTKLLLSELNQKDAEVLRRIILKDLRCGVSTSTINKIWPNLILDPPYMRCSLLKHMKNPDWSNGIYAQVKEDGMFCNIDYHSATEPPNMYTRAGTPLDTQKFQDIIHEFSRIMQAGYSYHGELLVEVDGTIALREVGNGILNSILDGGDFASNQKPILVLWDMVSINSTKNKVPDNTPYKTRFQKLTSLVESSKIIRLVDSTIVYSYEDAMSEYHKRLSEGKEGIILKYPNSIWRDGTSKEMFKVKMEVVVDLEITGFTEGNGKNKSTFGSIECKSSDGLLVVNVSGFTDKDRKHFSDIRESLIGKIVAVKGNSIMKPQLEGNPYSIFLPRFVEIRYDKTKADTLEEIINQFKMENSNDEASTN